MANLGDAPANRDPTAAPAGGSGTRYVGPGLGSAPANKDPNAQTQWDAAIAANKLKKQQADAAAAQAAASAKLQSNGEQLSGRGSFFVPPPIKRDANTMQAYLALNPNETQQSDKLLSKANDQYAQGLATMKHVGEVMALAKLGAAGIKQQQAVLNQNGFKVPVTGIMDKATSDSLQLWHDKTLQDAQKTVQDAVTAAHPGTIRAQTNASLAPQVPKERAYILDRAKSGIQEITKALIQSYGPNYRDLGNIGGAKGDALAKTDPRYTNYMQQLDAYQNLLKMANDPIRHWDNHMVHQVFLNTVAHEQAVLQDAAKNKGSTSFWSLAKEAAGATLAGTIGKLFQPETDYIGSIFAAGMEGGFHGGYTGNWWEGLQAAAAAAIELPYLSGSTDIGPIHINSPLDAVSKSIAPPGSSASAAVGATATRAARDELVKQGDLVSLGQMLTGNYTQAFKDKHGDAPFKVHDFSIGNTHLVSGAIDAAATLATDPLTWAFAAAKPYELIGKIAGDRALETALQDAPHLVEKYGASAFRQYGRAQVLSSTATGRRLMDKIGIALDNVARTDTIQGLKAAIKDLPTETAARILEARAGAISDEAASLAARQVVFDAFQQGIYNPRIGVVRQITNAAGEKAGIFSHTAIEPSLGTGMFGNAVKLTDRIQMIRNIAVDRGILAGAYESSAVRFITSATDVALRTVGKGISQVWRDAVLPHIQNLDVLARFDRVVAHIESINSPALLAARDSTLRPFFNNVSLLKNIPVNSYFEAVLAQPGFEGVIRQLEVAVAFASGDVAHEAATNQFLADLARGYVPKGSEALRLVATAAKDVGLRLPTAVTKDVTHVSVQNLIDKLPQELQSHFADLLARVGGKQSHLGALGRDVQAVLDNRALRHEVLAQVKQEAQRAAEYKTALPNSVGLGKKLLQKPARLILSNIDVAADPSMRFQSATENAMSHQMYRGRGAARTLDAFYVTGAVKDSLVRAMEQVKTEGEFAAVAERIARAGMEAKGVQNPDAVLEIMRNQGHFTAKSTSGALMSLDEAGNRVTDVQMLAQRIETVRMPTPEEVMQAWRKAVIAGTQDANYAQRLAATLHGSIDKVGNITFRLESRSGKLITLSNTVHGLYRQWKFLVVSNAAMPTIGAVGGFIGAGGSITDRLKGAGLGFGYGVTAAFGHYLFKVTGIEDRTRMLLAGGPTSDASIPGWAKIASRRGESDVNRVVLSPDLVKQGNYGINHFENDFLVTVDPAWVVVDRSESRAPDAWSRIHNDQIHPESDPVTAILLREKAGHLATTEEHLVTQEVKVAQKAAATEGTAATGWTEANALPVMSMQVTPGMIDDVAAKSVDVPIDSVVAMQGHVNPEQVASILAAGPVEETAASAIKVVDAGNGNFILEDGNHRVAAAIARGDTSINATLTGVVRDEGLIAHIQGKLEDRIGTVTNQGVVHSNAPLAEQLPRPIGGDIPTTTRSFTATTFTTDRQVADAHIAEFLKTDEGKIWAARAKEAGASPKAMVERMRKFIDRYSTPDLAAMRVSGGPEGMATRIERSTFARKLKAGEGPQAFHAQESWRVPKNASDLYRKYQTTVQRYVLSGPSNVLNRRPWQNAIFAGEYDRLLLEGVPREQAQRVADEFATLRVNSVLHRFDEPTRFAAKLDRTAFIPFQHAREDIVKVYGKLIAERPFHALRVGFYAARVFNDAAQTGLFTKNEFTGQWEVTLPGNGRLGQSMYGTIFSVPFHANVKDLLFVASGPDNLGFVPQPGGPWWSLFSRELATAMPHVFEGDNAVHHWLLRYGPSGDILPKSSNRLWMGLTGTTPPWEVANQTTWKNEHEHVQIEITQELIHQHLLKLPGDTTWLPTKAAVDEATSHYYDVWAFHSAMSPIGAFPVLTSQAKYEAARNAYTLGGVLPFQPDEFLKKYPEFAPYLAGSGGKYVGPDDLATLKRLNVGSGPGSFTKFNPETGMWDNLTPKYARENTKAESQLGYKQYSWADWVDKFKKNQRTSDYFKALDEAHSNPVPADREKLLIAVDHKYADVKKDSLRGEFIKKDVYTVLTTYPMQAQAAALQRIKNQYGLSNLDMLTYQKKVMNPTEMLTQYKLSPWTGARSADEVIAAVVDKLGKNASPFASAQYVATLTPAEQYNYWNGIKHSVGDPFMSPHDIMAEYKFANEMLYAVEKNNPQLFPTKTTIPGHPFYDANYVNPFTALVTAEKTNINAAISATFTAIDKITAEMQAAAASKTWKVYYALKGKQSLLYDHASALHNQLLNNLPDLTKYYEDLHAASVYDTLGNVSAAAEARHQASIDQHPAEFVQISEQKAYINMPPVVQRAYLTELTQRLDMPHDKTPYAVTQYVKATTGLSKMYWEYLTPVQQHLLESHYPSQVANWKYTSDYYLHGQGAVKSGKVVPPDLQHAYDLMNAADKRGNMPKPAAYAQYLAMPYNPAAKAAFLNAHPEVKAYLKAGPFANMSAVDKAFVSSTLAKYGKGFSSSGSSGRRGSAYGTKGPFAGIKWAKKGTGPQGGGQAMDLAWAKEQMTLWSRRPKGALAPDTYNFWLNMPSGQDKATYMTQHPEIAAWIQLGPMVNMPEDYKNVVRDIMVHYNGWTIKADPLGATITEFYAQPGYARQTYLLNHPELEVYWAATRTADQQAKVDLQNSYFKIQDVGARRAFLAEHPELQTQFLDARNKRYNRFLNQVAVYMGANPHLFNDWMTRQNDVLAELLQKFAEPQLIKEVGPGYVASDVVGTDAGRTRTAQKAPRNRAGV